MTAQSPVMISGAVEDPIDEAVLRRLVQHVGATLGPVYGKNGKKQLQQQIHGYNQAARFTPWVVLVDLDPDSAHIAHHRSGRSGCLTPRLISVFGLPCGRSKPGCSRTVNASLVSSALRFPICRGLLKPWRMQNRPW